MPTFKESVEGIGLVIDAAGVLVIVLGLLIATIRFAVIGLREETGYRRFRQDLGMGILLGLEFLVAADIIRTVAVVPTLQGVLVLGLIVLIRTFLSMALQIELDGRLPWHQKAAEPQVPIQNSKSYSEPVTGHKQVDESSSELGS
jgi:uncharacterized membrane protein